MGLPSATFISTMLWQNPTISSEDENLDVMNSTTFFRSWKIDDTKGQKNKEKWETLYAGCELCMLGKQMWQSALASCRFNDEKMKHSSLQGGLKGLQALSCPPNSW